DRGKGRSRVGAGRPRRRRGARAAGKSARGGNEQEAGDQGGGAETGSRQTARLPDRRRSSSGAGVALRPELVREPAPSGQGFSHKLHSGAAHAGAPRIPRTGCRECGGVTKLEVSVSQALEL